jgi:uncharacterized membrane protein
MPNRKVALTWGGHSGLFLVIILVCLGVLFRVANLDHKVFWVDEAGTAFRIAGYPERELIAEISDGRLLTPEDLLNYQRLKPDKTWADTVRALINTPEVPPLYFLIARFWSQHWGSSVFALRSLSVLFSLIALPCVYWLCLELFPSVVMGWAAVGILSVCPFLISYAQEARPYSLWLVTLLLSGGTLLRAIRLNTPASWSFYALTLTMSFYTSLFSILVAVGYSLYATAVESWQFTQRIRNYAIALGVALLAFTPWLMVMAQHWRLMQDNTAWTSVPLGWFPTIVIWLYSFAILFFDVPVVTTLPIALIEVLVALAVLGLIAHTLYFMLVKAPRRTWLFVLTLCIPTPLILILLDLIRNGQASTAPRYMLPAQLGVLLATAYLLSCPFHFPKPPQIESQTWKFMTVTLLSLCLLSCLFNLERSPIYQKSRSLDNLPIAAILNQVNSPTLLAEPSQIIDLLSLSHILQPNNKIQVLPTAKLVSKVSPCQDIFFLNPSAELIEQIQARKHFHLKAAYTPQTLTANELALSLWRVDDLEHNCPVSN